MRHYRRALCSRVAAGAAALRQEHSPPPSVIQPAGLLERALVHSIVSWLAFLIYKCIYSCAKSMTPPHICLEQTSIYRRYYRGPAQRCPNAAAHSLNYSSGFSQGDTCLERACACVRRVIPTALCKPPESTGAAGFATTLHEEERRLRSMRSANRRQVMHAYM